MTPEILAACHTNATMEPPKKIQELVARYQRNRDAYRNPSYGEAEVRKEFVDPLFKALGWDVDNEQGYAEPYKHVIHEASVQVQGAPKAPDYSFRVGGTRKFFLEAKKPSTNLKGTFAPAFQLRRYGWSAGLELSVLTDFEEFAVYDCQIRPEKGDRPSVARVLYLTVDEYLERWDEIAGIFAREAVLKGSFDRYAASTADKRGTAEVDDVFLEEIEGWRELLAHNIARRNPDLSRRELNAAVQRTIDRIIFLRICEDRGIEDYGQLREAREKGDVYDALTDLYLHADNKYNSGLFHFREEAGREEGPDTYTLDLDVGNEPLREILQGLYYPESPYEFSVLPADILGHVYERFLGSTIQLTDGHEAQVEQKPEVRKAGGVYYTPTFIVDYIVEHALGPKLEGQRPDDVAEITVLDPACGSGHFLVHAYQHLLDWHLNWYVEEGLQYKKYRDRVREGAEGDPVLTTEEKRRILVNNIYGVDIDAQAVEVTKLSLLLKVLEGETSETIEAQLEFMAERALPDLASNIKCGNSLLEPDYYGRQQLSLTDENELYRVNPFDWQKSFAEIFKKGGGFDVIIGNPPYILLEDDFRDEDQLDYFRERYEAASYKLDTYHLFMERGLQLAADGGLFSMITPSNFLTNKYLADLRRLLARKSHIDHIMVIDGGVFEGVSVDNAVWLLEAGAETNDPFAVRRVALANGSQLEHRRTDYVAVDPEDKHALFTGGGGPELAATWKQLKEDCQTLGELAHVNFGKQLRSKKKHPDDIIEVEKLSDVPDDYRPCYTGSDITRYELSWNGRACLDDEVARSGGTWNPERQNARSKLLCRQVGEYPFFAIDEAGHQVLNRAFMVNLRKEAEGFTPELLIGLLNSRLLRALWLHKFYDQRDTFPKIKGTYLKKLPIPYLDADNEDQQALVAEIVDGVQSLRHLMKQRRQAKTEHQREVVTRQIEAVDEDLDARVFALYGIEDDAWKTILEELPELTA